MYQKFYAREFLKSSKFCLGAHDVWRCCCGLQSSPALHQAAHAREVANLGSMAFCNSGISAMASLISPRTVFWGLPNLQLGSGWLAELCQTAKWFPDMICSMFSLCSVGTVLVELILKYMSQRKFCRIHNYGNDSGVPKIGSAMKQIDEIHQFHQLLFLLTPAGLNGTGLFSLASPI